MNFCLRIPMLLLMAFSPALAAAQAASGSIGGVVRGPEGEFVPDVPIRVTNLENDRYFRTSSDAEGRFAFTEL